MRNVSTLQAAPVLKSSADSKSAAARRASSSLAAGTSDSAIAPTNLFRIRSACRSAFCGLGTPAEINCGECGGVYALNERYRQQREDKGGFWHCPYCQVSWGYGKGALQKAREALEAEQQRHRDTLARLNEAAAERDRQAAAAARAKKRAMAGLCQCCNRSFTNLARHMATKHKEP